MKNLSQFFGCRLLCSLVLFCALLFSWSAEAAGGIKSMRIGQGVGTVRIVFDADKKFDYEKLMRRRFKNRDWDSFPAWMGYGIGPFTI